MKIVGKVVVIEENRPGDDEASFDLIGVFDEFQEAKDHVIELIKKYELPMDEIRGSDESGEYRFVGHNDSSTTWKFITS